MVDPYDSVSTIVLYTAIYNYTFIKVAYRAGSSMRLLRLRPQGPGPGPPRYNENLQSRTKYLLTYSCSAIYGRPE